MKERELLISATRFVYSIKNLSSETLVHWSELLRYLFRNELNLPEIKASEIAAALRPFKNSNEAIEYFKSLPTTDQVNLISFIKLLFVYADKTNDLQSKKELTSYIDRLGMESTQSENEIAIKSEELLKGFIDFQNRKKILVPGSIRLFSLDYLLRWIALVISINFLDEGWVLMLNILLVPIVILLLARFQSKKDKSFNEGRIISHNLKLHSSLRLTYTTGQYTLLAIFIITGAIVTSLLFNRANAAIIHFILIAGLVAYYIFILVTFPIGRLDENYLEEQLAKKDSSDFKDADENDERIVLLETQLTSSSGRLEAYVLESALFGALAFSAFLQIFATNLISFADVEKFASSVHHFAHGLINGDWKEFNLNLSALSNKESLFSLISIETLICSGLFVAVIASRLRFSHVADRLRTYLNLAKAFNEKEEKLLESEDPAFRNSERFAKINQRVHEYLEDASKKLIEIAPIVNYIVYFRNLGVLMFTGVLVTSCLFISNSLAWGFLVVAAATWVYFNFQAIKIWASSLDLRTKIYFAKHSYRLLAVSFLPLVLAFILKINFGIQESDYLVTLTLFLLTIYFAAAAIQPYYDSKFGDIETGSGWNTLKTSYSISILISGLGLTMKSMSIFSDAFIVIGFTLMGVINFAISFYLTKKKWLGVLMGMALSLGVFGLLFKNMAWTGSNEMIILALPFWLFFLFAFVLQRKLFHKLFLKFALVYGIGLVFISSYYIVFELSFSPLGFSKLAYQHETLNIGPLIEIKNRIYFKNGPNWGDVSDAEIKRSINVMEDYSKKYGMRCGFTEIYRSGLGYYDIFAEETAMDSRKKADSASLAKVYLVILEGERINKMFNYKYSYLLHYVTQSVLEQMEKKEELLNYYNDILALSPDEKFKELVKFEVSSFKKREKIIQ